MQLVARSKAIPGTLAAPTVLGLVDILEQRGLLGAEGGQSTRMH